MVGLFLYQIIGKDFMFDLKKYIIKHFTKIKVVHSIPGRIRLKLSNMTKLPKECKFYDNYLKGAITMIEGIEEVNFNYIIGTIIIKYNINKVYEIKILKWLDKIVEIGIDNFEFIQTYGEKNLDYVIKTLEQDLKDAINII